MLNKDIIQYVESYLGYQKNKAVTHKLYSLLQSLGLAYLQWKSIAIDFITALRLS
jgi:hypothetical protein